MLYSLDSCYDRYDSSLVLCLLGGLLAGSLAVATDATHMASDLAGFLISLVAIWLSRKPATHRLSFGFYRAGPLSFYSLKQESCAVAKMTARCALYK